MRAFCRGVLFGFCKILDIVKLHIVKTTITIISYINRITEGSNCLGKDQKIKQWNISKEGGE